MVSTKFGSVKRLLGLTPDGKKMRKVVKENAKVNYKGYFVFKTILNNNDPFILIHSGTNTIKIFCHN